MFSISQSAYLFVMGSNLLNPSDYKARPVDDSSWSAQTGLLENGKKAVTVLGDVNKGNRSQFEGLDIFEREHKVGSHVAAELLRIAARTVCILAIMVLATPIDAVINILGIGYHSFQWVTSTWGSDDQKEALKNLSNRFYQLCTNISIIALSLIIVKIAEIQAIDMGQEVTLGSLAPAGLLFPTLYSLRASVADEFALAMFVPHKNRLAALIAILLKEHGGIESVNGGLVSAREIDFTVFENVRQTTATLLLENIQHLQTTWERESGHRIPAHYPPSLKTILTHCNNPENYCASKKQERILKAIINNFAELEAVDKMIISIQEVRDRNLFLDTLLRREKKIVASDFPIKEQPAGAYFDPDFNEMADDLVAPKNRIELDTFDLVPIPANATVVEKEFFTYINEVADKKDPYEVLGLSEDADLTRIQRRSRTILVCIHPDKAPSGYKDQAMVATQKVNAAQAYCLSKIKT